MWCAKKTTFNPASTSDFLNNTSCQMTEIGTSMPFVAVAGSHGWGSVSNLGTGLSLRAEVQPNLLLQARSDFSVKAVVPVSFFIHSPSLKHLPVMHKPFFLHRGHPSLYSEPHTEKSHCIWKCMPVCVALARQNVAPEPFVILPFLPKTKESPQKRLVSNAWNWSSKLTGLLLSFTRNRTPSNPVIFLSQSLVFAMNEASTQFN